MPQRGNKCDWQTTKFGEQVDGPTSRVDAGKTQRRMRRSRRAEVPKAQEEKAKGGRKREEAYSCYRKWVKRQVERATNLNHRQFRAVQFDSARSFLKPPSTTSIFTFPVFRLPALWPHSRASTARHRSRFRSNNESTSGLFSRCLICTSTRAQLQTRRIRSDGVCLRPIKRARHRSVHMLVLTLAIISITGVAPRRANVIVIASRVCINAGRFTRNAISCIMTGDTRLLRVIFPAGVSRGVIITLQGTIISLPADNYRRSDLIDIWS